MDIKTYQKEYHKEYRNLKGDKLREYSREYSRKNRKKLREYVKNYRIENSDKLKKQRQEYYLKVKDREYYRLIYKKYGITAEQLSKMKLSQDNKCAICGERFGRRKCCVDHNHTTGQVRGLLCSLCNSAIAHFKENINIIHSAITYITKWNN